MAAWATSASFSLSVWAISPLRFPASRRRRLSSRMRAAFRFTAAAFFPSSSFTLLIVSSAIGIPSSLFPVSFPVFSAFSFSMSFRFSSVLCLTAECVFSPLLAVLLPCCFSAGCPNGSPSAAQLLSPGRPPTLRNRPRHPYLSALFFGFLCHTGSAQPAPSEARNQ